VLAIGSFSSAADICQLLLLNARALARIYVVFTFPSAFIRGRRIREQGMASDSDNLSVRWQRLEAFTELPGNLLRHPHGHLHRLAGQVYDRTAVPHGNAARSHRIAVVAERHVKKVYR